MFRFGLSVLHFSYLHFISFCFQQLLKMVSSSIDTQYFHYYWVLWSECFTINSWETKLLWNLNQSTHTHIQKPDTIHTTKTRENSSLIYSLFYSPILSHSLGSFSHSIIYLLNHSLTNLFTHSPISLFPHLLTYVTHSLTHSSNQ